MAICSNCRSKTKQLLKKIDARLVKNVDAAIAVTTRIKNAFNSPFAITVTRLIPGQYDDVLRERITAALGVALKYLGWLKAGTELSHINYDEYVSTLREMPEGMRDGALMKIASVITKELDGRFSTHLYDTAVQVHYTLNK